MCRYASLSVCQSVTVCHLYAFQFSDSLSLSICQTSILRICKCDRLSVCQFINVSVCHVINLSICQSATLAVCLLACMPFCLPVYVCLFISLSVYPSMSCVLKFVCVSICIFTPLFVSASIIMFPFLVFSVVNVFVLYFR